MNKVVLFLMLFAVSSNKLKSNSSDRISVSKSSGNNNHCSNDSICPTWFTCNAKKKCQCDSGRTTAIRCNNQTQTSAVLNCNCIPYDNESKSTYVGACFYNCVTSGPSYDSLIQKLPENPEMLISNYSICKNFYRTGLLCGNCKDGYSPLVLSYDLSCVECPDGHKNWWKFFMTGFLPLTAFYLFILAFNINVTSFRLHGVVWYSQTLSMPALIRIILLTCRIKEMEYLNVTKTILVFYSLWNLDLFRSILPNICLNVTTLQALALEYLIALYPFVLILFTYLLIVLYDRRLAFIVAVWTPFKKVLTVFRKSWDIRTSVLDSFATFFLLSYNKALSVTVDILIPTKIHQLGSNKSMFGLYYSPSISYFGKYHLPYAILAVTIVTLFVCIPTTILICYPCKFFQKFLSLFPFNWHFLHAFVDSFQGCYKDGTEPGTFDCRWFSVYMLLMRPLLFIIYGLTLSIMFFIYSLIAILILLLVIINFQPLKKVGLQYPLYNLIFLILLCLTNIAILGRELTYIERYSAYHTVLTITVFLTVIIPILYISYLIGSWLFSRINVRIPRLPFLYR